MESTIMRARLRGAARAAWAALRRRGGQIAYYSVVALTLTILALAASAYRGGRAPAPEAAPSAVEFAAGEQGAEEEAAAAPLALPEGAEVLRGYSEAPAWSAELGQWGSHPALDIRAEGAVESLCPGEVCVVGKSGAWGGFVEVDCGAFALRYASVAPREDLEIGDALAAGEAIGVADGSMPGEANLAPHFHLEALREGAAVDPASLANGD